MQSLLFHPVTNSDDSDVERTPPQTAESTPENSDSDDSTYGPALPPAEAGTSGTSQKKAPEVSDSEDDDSDSEPDEVRKTRINNDLYLKLWISIKQL